MAKPEILIEGLKKQEVEQELEKQLPQNLSKMEPQ
jgi:hypothetical protein